MGRYVLRLRLCFRLITGRLCRRYQGSLGHASIVNIGSTSAGYGETNEEFL
jgi:hypothetical protein